MSGLRLDIFPYERPLRRPITTAHGTYTVRSGMLLILRDRDGCDGLGDAAPLPGFSRESFDAVCERAQQLRDVVADSGNDPSRGVEIPESFAEMRRHASFWEKLTADCPSLRFAWETALADLAARRQGIPLARWLTDCVASCVPVNALLADTDPGVLTRQACDAAAAGFKTFKIKAGVVSVEQDIARIAAVRAAVPSARLRVDANGAWNEATAGIALAALSGLRPEFIEQPLPAGQSAQARQLCRHHGARLALDEDADAEANAHRLLEDGLCDVIVLKPMILGGLIVCMRLAECAQQHGINVVYTSSWESDVGVAATLHLAAALGTDPPAAGLATAGAIAAGLVTPPLRIVEGRLCLSDEPGLGLQLVEPK